MTADFASRRASRLSSCRETLDSRIAGRFRSDALHRLKSGTHGILTRHWPAHIRLETLEKLVGGRIRDEIVLRAGRGGRRLSCRLLGIHSEFQVGLILDQTEG
jgi:hypothetical protein